MSSTHAVAAIDLGATSGRVILGLVSSDGIETIETGRFANTLQEIEGTLCWNIEALWKGIKNGLRKAGQECSQRNIPLESIGIDSWAVDYVPVDPSGNRVGEAVCYRDSRTDGARERYSAHVAPTRQFEITGLAAQPFNTVYQLFVDERTQNKNLMYLMIPDYIAFLLTGEKTAEVTNLSTTGLFDASNRCLSAELLEPLGLSADNFGRFVEPGEKIGSVSSELGQELGIGEPSVIAVASHDTASAVLAVPALTKNFSYISSGTWSLLGLENDRVILDEEARLAGFTNEGGVEGTFRFLKNLSGMWLISESIRQWDADGNPQDLFDLLDAAAALPPQPTFDVTDASFNAPKRMADRISQALIENGHPKPQSPAHLVRSIIDSLAKSYVDNIELACKLAKSDKIEALHIVGGGSQNQLLCQITANQLDIPIITGPVEGSALGNIGVQAQTLGIIAPGRQKLREYLTTIIDLKTYTKSEAYS